jgi:threonine dehydratase
METTRFNSSALRIAADITQLVGSTPMLELTRVAPQPAAAVFAKLEFLNPGGSIKDRAALGMILDAEARGLLHPGSTILEATAGNAGADWSQSRLPSEVVCARGFRRGEVHSDARLRRGGGAHARG